VSDTTFLIQLDAKVEHNNSLVNDRRLRLWSLEPIPQACHWEEQIVSVRLSLLAVSTEAAASTKEKREHAKTIFDSLFIAFN
jgi:hypothetical protein